MTIVTDEVYDFRNRREERRLQQEFTDLTYSAYISTYFYFFITKVCCLTILFCEFVTQERED